MKLALSIILLFSSLAAAQLEEVLVIEQLIETTQKNLIAQQTLLQKLNEYTVARDGFIADPDSSKWATRLVKKAVLLQAHLEKENLTHLFSNDFLTELTFYNQVGKRQLVER